jgi:hypothetical protein
MYSSNDSANPFLPGSRFEEDAYAVLRFPSLARTERVLTPAERSAPFRTTAAFAQQLWRTLREMSPSG